MTSQEEKTPTLEGGSPRSSVELPYHPDAVDRAFWRGFMKGSWVDEEVSEEENDGEAGGIEPAPIQ